jgi:Fe2+ or Zn2+ uptake regulation protein
MDSGTKNPEGGALTEEALRRTLESAGWRYTRQRAAVYAYLCGTDCHPTAEQVFAAVRRQLPHISLATIYKALEALVDARLATRIADSTGPARYDGRSEAHYHLRCERTGQLRDLPLPYDPRLPDKVSPDLVETLRRLGFELTGHRLELVGQFRAPAAATSPPEPPG